MKKMKSILWNVAPFLIVALIGALFGVIPDDMIKLKGATAIAFFSSIIIVPAIFTFVED